MNTHSMVLFLKQEYAARVERKPGYSMRAYALYLQVDHSLLAKIFRGERNLSKNMSFKVGEKLGLSAETVQEKISAPKPELIMPIPAASLAYAL